MDLCLDGDLKTYLEESHHFLSETECINIFSQICLAFRKLRAENICHRDLKPANILIHDSSIKISDFGFSRIYDETQLAVTKIGTPYYMSLQSITQKSYNPMKQDVWSSGIILYQMLFGVLPWQAKEYNIMSLVQSIMSQELKFPDTPRRSEWVKTLISNILKKEEGER